MMVKMVNIQPLKFTCSMSVHAYQWFVAKKLLD